MPWQNLVFVFLSPLLLIATIAAFVVGLGTLLLESRYYADHLHELGQMSTDVAKLVPVAIALAASTIVFLGAVLLSLTGRSTARLGGRAPRH